MDIRRIQFSELNALLGLYDHLHRADAPRPAPDVVESIWREAQDNPRCRYFGVYCDDRLVASCALMLIPNLTRGCRPYGMIENVVTHAEFRDKGLGRAVLKHALAFAWAENAYKVVLLTGRKDAAIMRFYEGAGFDRHGKQGFVAKPS